MGSTAMTVTTDSGAVTLVEDREYMIGRGPDVDVVVAGKRVSRQHCSVVVAGGTWELRDLRSANGTFVGGQRVAELRGAAAVEVHLGDPDGAAFTVGPIGHRAVRATQRPHSPGPAVAAPPPAQPPRPPAAQPPPSAPPASGSTDQTVVGAPPPVPTEAASASGPAYQVPAEEQYGLELTAVHRLGAVLRIGRDPGNDIVIDDLMVSRFHAHVRREAGAVEVVDLGSSNGTYVNGRRVMGIALVPGDVVGIGRTSLVFDGASLRQLEETGGLEFQAQGLTVEVGSGSARKTLMHDVSFRLAPRSVLAVIGPSGAGKSTLLNALTGQRPADIGTVEYAGRDLYAEYDELRNRIGMVPQDDLLHTQLTVKRALSYGAALRFPAETTRAERGERVTQVMGELGLAERENLRIDRLSGGQRKRTSVAIELLTKPSLLFLDEPTSGLDPGLDLQVMQMLRGLADEGRTVVVVTHSVANLDQCDNVMILAAGGYVAYFGPPAEAPEYFGVADYAQIFLTMETEPGEQWDRRFRASEYYRRSGAQPEPGEVGAAARADLSRVRQQSFLSQLATLARRYVSVITSDRAYLAFLVILPLMLAGVGILVGTDDGLGSGEAVMPPDPGAADPGAADPGAAAAAPAVPPNAGARFVLLVLVLGAAFTGTASSIQELVKERTIYQRERSIGLSRGAYLLSKLLVLGVITSAQAVLFSSVALLGRPGPDEGLVLGNGTLEIILVAAVLAVVSMALGLLLSAVIPTAEVALPALVVVTMVQMVLSGAVPIRFDVLLDALGWLVPSYWAFSAMAATVDLGFLSAVTDVSGLWEHSAAVWLRDMAVLGGWFLVYTVLAYLALRRREPKRG